MWCGRDYVYLWIIQSATTNTDKSNHEKKASQIEYWDSKRDSCARAPKGELLEHKFDWMQNPFKYEANNYGNKSCHSRQFNRLIIFYLPIGRYGLLSECKVTTIFQISNTDINLSEIMEFGPTT